MADFAVTEVAPAASPALRQLSLISYESVLQLLDSPNRKQTFFTPGVRSQCESPPFGQEDPASSIQRTVTCNGKLIETLANRRENLRRSPSYRSFLGVSIGSHQFARSAAFGTQRSQVQILSARLSQPFETLVLSSDQELARPD